MLEHDSSDALADYQPIVIVTGQGLQAKGHAPVALPRPLALRLKQALAEQVRRFTRRHLVLRVWRRLELLLDDCADELRQLGVFHYLLRTCSVHPTLFIIRDDDFGGGTPLPHRAIQKNPPEGGFFC